MRKIISIVTVLCFLVSNASFASNINLANPSAIDDIAPFHKYRALAEMGFQLFLQEVARTRPDLITGNATLEDLQEVFGKQQKNIYRENTHKNAAGVTACFDEMVKLGMPGLCVV